MTSILLEQEALTDRAACFKAESTKAEIETLLLERRARALEEEHETIRRSMRVPRVVTTLEAVSLSTPIFPSATDRVSQDSTVVGAPVARGWSVHSHHSSVTLPLQRRTPQGSPPRTPVAGLASAARARSDLVDSGAFSPNGSCSLPAAQPGIAESQPRRPPGRSAVMDSQSHQALRGRNLAPSRSSPTNAGLCGPPPKVSDANARGSEFASSGVPSCDRETTVRRTRVPDERLPLHGHMTPDHRPTDAKLANGHSPALTRSCSAISLSNSSSNREVVLLRSPALAKSPSSASMGTKTRNLMSTRSPSSKTLTVESSAGARPLRRDSSKTGLGVCGR